MRKVRSNIVGLPYSLHDSRVKEIQIQGNNIIFNFSYGFFEPVNGDALPVEGEVSLFIGKADLDFCSAYVFDTNGSIGKFTGEKLELPDFISKFPDLEFEIVDETYGYNKSKFFGYLYIGECIRECLVEIYHFGDMEYVMEGKEDD